MPRVKIDDIAIEVPQGASVLDAAAAAGVSIPTLCYEKSVGAITSCMVCVVRDKRTGRMLPACSAKISEGMEIDTSGEEVREARREILEMLLSEHVGDCEAPCRRICPAELNIPRMLRYIVAGEEEAAARLAYRDLIFPATLGRICTAPCEKGCRRGTYDAPVSIRASHGEVADRVLRNGLKVEDRSAPSGKTVAVVGAGIAGLAAAAVLVRNGHACRVFEKQDVTCLLLRTLPENDLPGDVLETEIARIEAMGAEWVLGCEVGADRSVESVLTGHDAVIFACDVEFPPSPEAFRAQEDSMPVRAVAQGKLAASSVEQFLCGAVRESVGKPFNSQIGRLRHEEIEPYAVERRRDTDSPGSASSIAEAERCLACDCRKPVSCKLRRYANEYGVDSRIKRHMERPPVQPILRAGEVLFEPGKCIKCGICVEITRRAGHKIGLALAGRGLASRVEVPFGEPLKEGLGEVSAECVRACPTGALAFRNEEETV